MSKKYNRASTQNAIKINPQVSEKLFEEIYVDIVDPCRVSLYRGLTLHKHIFTNENN